MDRKILFTIDDEIHAEAFGFHGQGCENVLGKFMDAAGLVAEGPATHKEEYYLPAPEGDLEENLE